MPTWPINIRTQKTVFYFQVLFWVVFGGSAFNPSYSVVSKQANVARSGGQAGWGVVEVTTSSRTGRPWARAHKGGTIDPDLGRPTPGDRGNGGGLAAVALPSFDRTSLTARFGARPSPQILQMVTVVTAGAGSKATVPGAVLRIATCSMNGSSENEASANTRTI